MKKRIIQIIFLLLAVSLASWLWDSPESQALTRSSDRLSSSWPGGLSDHNISFRTTEDIPAGGRIRVDFDPGFVFDANFGVNSIDLAVDSGGGYVDRLLSSTSVASYDQVSVSGTSVIFDLSSVQGIPAGSYVSVEMGLNADYQATGTRYQIRNPLDPTQHRIEVRTYDDSGAYLERSGIAVFIIEPVTMSSAGPKIRMRGAPLGYLSYETSQTIMSLYTNFASRCRYSTSTGISYENMSNDFSYAATSTGEYYHTVIVSGFSPGNEYSYFVRCRDDDGEYDDYTRCTYPSASTTPVHTASGTPITDYQCLDYEITFNITSIAGAEGDESGHGGPNDEGDDAGEDDSETSADGDSDGSSSAGGGGSGGGGGGGTGQTTGSERGDYFPYPPPPGSPGVALQGWGYVSQDVIILQDGQEIGVAEGKSDASFGGFIEDLTKGVYTFSLWSDDAQGRRSRTYSTTFWINDGTQTTVSDILLPPTIELDKKEVSAGEPVAARGASAPGAEIDVWFYPDKSDLAEAEISKSRVVVSATGGWSLNLNTEGKTSGQYKVKARVIKAEAGESQFSQEMGLAIGASLEESGSCPGADLNQDGRVNITDFSILLYHWGTANACADQNGDGNVNLIDFSIMMYNWTG